jgi:type I restriction enzyme S subunit
MSENGKIRIGDHVNILPGFPFNSRLFNTDGLGLPLIRIRDLLQSKIETYYDGEYQTEFAIKEGDILIGMDGDFHIVKWKNKRRALLNQRILKVAQKQGGQIDVNYFYYYLFPFIKNVWDRTTATTVKHLSTYDISEALGSFPSISEQREIAKILSTADALIEKTQQAIAKYKVIKQGMLHDLFTRGIDVKAGKLRPKYEDAPELYKESKLGWIPKEWEEDRLEKIALAVDPQPDHRTPAAVDNGIPYLGINDIDYYSNIDFQKCRQVSYQVLQEHNKRYQVRDGDIIFGKIGTVGEPKRLVNFGKLTLSANVILIQPYGLSDYVYWLLTSELVDRQVKNSIHSTSQPAFGMDKIRVLKVPVCSPVEQRLISEKLNALESTSRIEQLYLHKLQQIKQGLMSDLLSGKKRVKVEEK